MSGGVEASESHTGSSPGAATRTAAISTPPASGGPTSTSTTVPASSRPRPSPSPGPFDRWLERMTLRGRRMGRSLHDNFLYGFFVLLVLYICVTAAYILIAAARELDNAIFSLIDGGDVVEQLGGEQQATLQNLVDNYHMLAQHPGGGNYTNAGDAVSIGGRVLEHAAQHTFNEKFGGQRAPRWMAEDDDISAGPDLSDDLAESLSSGGWWWETVFGFGDDMRV